MTKLPPADPNGHAWRAYIAACNTHGTPSEQSRATFDTWWDLEVADSRLACAVEEKAEKRKQLQATSSPGRRS